MVNLQTLFIKNALKVQKVQKKKVTTPFLIPTLFSSDEWKNRNLGLKEEALVLALKLKSTTNNNISKCNSITIQQMGIPLQFSKEDIKRACNDSVPIQNATKMAKYSPTLCSRFARRLNPPAAPNLVCAKGKWRTRAEMANKAFFFTDSGCCSWWSNRTSSTSAPDSKAWNKFFKH